MSDQIMGDAPKTPPTPIVGSAGTTGDTPGATPPPNPAATADAGMTDRAKGMLMQTAPWRRGIGWPIIAIEALLAIGVGIYVIADPDGSKSAVRQILGAALLINGVLRIYAGFRESAQSLPAAPYRLVSGGIGLTVGLIVVLEPVSDYIDADAARVILAGGLLAFGVIGLAAAVGTRESGGLRIGAVITAAIYIVFAALFFYNVRHDNLNVKIFGYLLLIFGVLLGAYAYVLYRGAQQGDAAASAAAV
jgi:uncharacterized membrane protein HdeD (DUF308 family)